MSDDRPQLDWSEVSLSDDFIWTDGVSSKGHAFKIGTSKPNAMSTADAEQAPDLGENQTCSTSNEETLSVASKAGFDIQVYWTHSDTDEWSYPTAEETRITSITRYNLQTAAPPPFRLYEFCFCCTEAYHFYFYDKTGDCYGINVLWPRPSTIHWLYIGSSDPDIVRVTGS
ncbi:ribokinase-like protein [Aspergillus terreus]|uniref:Ribokinase-like protein n=1 Tax=Aspergillus terreus TaxID=33178 RepID=A0A5M3YXT8_ASPTE|nr:hypothetical protein ATETN484_0004000200 [Aspergillus terreus]GFF12892.1 ribokinase-like protein [Aspergillus terreus]